MAKLDLKDRMGEYEKAALPGRMSTHSVADRGFATVRLFSVFRHVGLALDYPQSAQRVVRMGPTMAALVRLASSVRSN